MNAFHSFLIHSLFEVIFLQFLCTLYYRACTNHGEHKMLFGPVWVTCGWRHGHKADGAVTLPKTKCPLPWMSWGFFIHVWSNCSSRYMHGNLEKASTILSFLTVHENMALRIFFALFSKLLKWLVGFQLAYNMIRKL